MAKNRAEWASGHRQLTRIGLSDGCGGELIPVAVQSGYHRNKFEGHLGNVGSGVMAGIFENCALVPSAAGEFFSAVHQRYVRNDTVNAGMILSVHRKVMDRQVATGSPTQVENVAKDTRDLAYSEIKRKFIVANEDPELVRRLCDDLLKRFRTGEWDNPRFVDTYFSLLERFDPRVYAEFYDMKAVLDDRRSGRLKTGKIPK